MIEARPSGLKPVAVKHKAPSVDLAIHGAIDKLKRSLEHLIEKMNLSVVVLSKYQMNYLSKKKAP